jgi:hypothetical protein
MSHPTRLFRTLPLLALAASLSLLASCATEPVPEPASVEPAAATAPAAPPSTVQPPAFPPAAAPVTREKADDTRTAGRRTILDAVWKVVRDKHYD